MIIRDLNREKATSRKVDTDGWSGVRLLLHDDGMGFSFHITTIFAGAELPMHYRNHLEAVYCMSGTGSIEDAETGDTHEIRPGILYALNEHDRHVLRADTEMEMVCVFSPPLHGQEVHDENGSFPLEVETA